MYSISILQGYCIIARIADQKYMLLKILLLMQSLDRKNYTHK